VSASEVLASRRRARPVHHFAVHRLRRLCPRRLRVDHRRGGRAASRSSGDEANRCHAADMVVGGGLGCRTVGWLGWRGAL